MQITLSPKGGQNWEENLKPQKAVGRFSTINLKKFSDRLLECFKERFSKRGLQICRHFFTHANSLMHSSRFLHKKKSTAFSTRFPQIRQSNYGRRGGKLCGKYMVTTASRHRRVEPFPCLENRPIPPANPFSRYCCMAVGFMKSSRPVGYSSGLLICTGIK